jgi:hypothetical protein
MWRKYHYEIRTLAKFRFEADGRQEQDTKINESGVIEHDIIRCLLPPSRLNKTNGSNYSLCEKASPRKHSCCDGKFCIPFYRNLFGYAGIYTETYLHVNIVSHFVVI